MAAHVSEAGEDRGLPESEFDAEFYCQTYHYVPDRTSAYSHFLTVGWVQGRDPSTQFSTFKYLLQNDDVLFRHLNPFVHYNLYGRQQGREALPHSDESYLPWDEDVANLVRLWFDEEFYAAMNPDLAGAPSLLNQFLVLGWVEGRDPSPKFSTHKYLWKYSDVMMAGVNPLLHYLTEGRFDGREIEPAEGSRYKVARNLTAAEWLDRVRGEFDPGFYASSYLNGSGDAADLFEHYQTTGWRLGYDPNPNFSVRRYLEQYNDIKTSGQDPFYHFVRHGRLEGRLSFPSEPADVRAEREQSEEEAKVRAEFDETYYRSRYPDLAGVDDVFAHYMSVGWKEGRNPSSQFDTGFYLKNQNDIREAGINPFRHFVLHGRREGRRGVSGIAELLENKDFQPSISVIVPNYNHARFLGERLQSIVDQNYPNIELIILDDCSTDDSADVIRAFAETYDGQCRCVFNEKNSGNVFSQWQKGMSLATGDLIWICESDDFCDKDFLRNIIFMLQDHSVRLVFGNIQFTDEQGRANESMTELRETAKAGIWDEVNVMPAASWFTGPLAERNLIANVGGVVFRNTPLPAGAWDIARTFQVAGDWFLYAMIAAGGQIAYVPTAKAYFRQHQSNTSVTAFDKPSFYKELARFHTFLRERWDVPLETTFRFYKNIADIFERSQLAADGHISDLVSLDTLLKVRKKITHLAVSFLNFEVGGGEIFPIELSNALHRSGYLVSAVVRTLETDNDFVRKWLDPGIPVYAASLYPQSGVELARDAGFDIIHSHNIWSEFYFLAGRGPSRFSYVSTLHGSYEVSQIRREQLAQFFDRVTWVYLAERNLEKFNEFGFDTASFRMIPNGFARRRSPTPVTRQALGIARTSVVFLFAARSHPEKGWMQTAQAFDRLTQEGFDAVLLMGGAGEEVEKVRQAFSHNKNIRLLGFRRDVDDLLEISDYLVLPTRFAGESMPLTLIQSFLASVPVITTDIGQIKEMMECKTGSAGVVMPAIADDDAFVEQLLIHMRAAAERKLTIGRAAFRHLAQKFKMETCLDRYLGLYRSVLEPRGQGLVPHCALTPSEAAADGQARHAGPLGNAGRFPSSTAKPAALVQLAACATAPQPVRPRRGKLDRVAS